MSKTIDQRVVEMQFDNKNFEKNVATSMSTLDKLKSALNFGGASRAMDELNNSFKAVNTSPLENAVDIVKGKFSALEEMAIGGLRRIGEKAVDTGEKLLKSLTIDNIASGWSKFGEETKAVATLRSQGYELELIEEQLELLNFFTDETSYNFTDMVSEIGKFTAAGQGLEESVTAMEGIASWAALSGQNAATASRAMYQLSQAMGAGVMRREDYKSIQTANMDTKEFRQRALDVAVAMGTLKKTANGTYKTLVGDAKEVNEFTIDQFANELTSGLWFTQDVMMAVFRDYGKAANGLKAYMDKMGIDTASEAMSDLRDKAKEYAEEMVRLGQADTVSEAMDAALKKVSIDELSEVPEITDKARAHMEEYNQSIIDAYNSTRQSGQKLITTVEEAVSAGLNPMLSLEDALVDLGYVVDEFSLKAFEAGQQARTWEDVLDSVRDAVSSKWSKTFKMIFGNEEEAITLWTKLANDFYELFAAGGDERNDMFSAWQAWIDPKTRNLLDAAKGIPSAVREALIADNTINGRDLLFSTEEGNLGAIISLVQTLKDLLAIVKDAWNEIFFGTSDVDEVAQKKADILMSITQGIKNFADSLAITDDKIEKIKDSFKGLFAIIDIIRMFIGSAFTSAWNGLSGIFGEINVDLLDMTQSMGNNIVAFRDWLKDNNIFEKSFEKLGNVIGTIVTSIKSFIDSIKQIPAVSDILGSIETFFTEISSGNPIDIFTKIGDEISKFDGLQSIISKISEGFKNFWDAIAGNLSTGSVDLTGIIKWISILAAVIAGIILLRKDASEANKSIISFGAVIAALAGIILAMALLSSPDEAKGFVDSLVLLMSAFAIALRIAGNVQGSGDVFIPIAIAVAALAAALVLLSVLPVSNVMDNTIALSVLLYVFSKSMTNLLKTIETMDAKKSQIKAAEKYMKVMVVFTALIGALLYAMSALKVENALENARAVSLLLIVISGIVGLVSVLDSLAVVFMMLNKVFKFVTFGKGGIDSVVENFKELIKPMIVIAALLIVMSALDVQNAIPNAIAIGVLMAVLTGVLYAINAMSENETSDPKKAIGNLALISAIAVILSIALAMLSGIEPAAAIANAISISILLLAMSASLILIDSVGTLAKGSYIALGAMTLVVILLGTMLGILGSLDLTNTFEIAASISLLLISMSVALLPLILVGTFASAVTAGLVVLFAFTVGFIALAVILGELMQYVPNFESWINTGLPLMQKIAYGMGEFFGNVIAGLLGGISNALPVIGQNIYSFCAALGNITPEMAAGAESLANVMLILAGAELINSIKNFLTSPLLGNSTSMGDMAVGLSAFGNAMVEFYNSVSEIKDVSRLNMAADAALAIVNIESALAKHGGLVQAITGDNTLKDFGKEMVEFAPDLVACCKILYEGKDYIDKPTVEAAASAASLLSALANNLPKHDGLLQGLIGDNTLTTFAEDMMGFAPKLLRVCEIFNDGRSNINPDIVQAAVTAATLIRDFGANLPAHGGVVQWFTGDQTLSQFATDMLAFAPSIVEFSKIVSEGDINQTAIDKAVGAAQIIAGLQDNLPEKKNAILAFFTGEKISFSEFAEDLPNLGAGIKGFSDALKGESGNDFDTSLVDSAVNVIQSLSLIENGLDSTKGGWGFLDIFAGQENNLKTFGDRLPDLAQGIVKFSNVLVQNGLDGTAIDVAIDAIERIAGIENSLDGTKGGWGFLDIFAGQENNLKTFGERLPYLATGISGFAVALSADGLNISNVSSSIDTAIAALDGLSKIDKAVGSDRSSWSFISTIMGFGGLSPFAANFPMLAKGIVGFAKEFIDTVSIDGMQRAIGVLNKTGEMNDLLEVVAQADKITALTGNLDMYREAISNLGDTLEAICSDETKFNEDKIQNISDRIDEISALADRAAKVDMTSINNLGALQYGSIGNTGGYNLDYSNVENMLNGTDALGGIDASSAGANWMMSGLGGMENFKFGDYDFGKITSGLTGSDGLGGLDLSAVGGDWFGSAFSGMENFDFGNFDFGGITNVLSGENALGGLDLSNVGGDWLGSILGGMSNEDSQKQVTEAGNEMADTFSDAMKTDANYEKFKSAGRNAVDGFVEGLKQKKWLVSSNGNDIAQALVDSIEEKLKIESPSRVMYGLGDYAGQGFINALRDYVGLAYTEGGEVADSATTGIQQALEQSAYMFDTTVDVEPTIRPVLDLSNIDDGLGQMNGMFNATRSVQLADAANLQMSAKDANIQNEIKIDNTDVVTAIGTLKDDIAEMAERMSNLQVYLDKNVLVGQMAAPMNKALGTTYRHNQREK